TWTSVGTISVTMAASVKSGLAVCAHANTVLNTTTFDNVAFTVPVVDINIAPSGTGYGWSGMTSGTANTGRTAQPGVNDNNLTADVDIQPAGDPVNAWE